MKKLMLSAMLFTITVSLSFGDIKHSFIVCDESRDNLVYIDENNPSANWSISIPKGRDMQLVGHNRVMVSRGDGFDEYDIATGAMVRSQSPEGVWGVQSCRRLSDGSTLMAAEGVTIWKVDSSGTVLRTISIPDMGTFRTMRISARGTFLIGSNCDLVETDTNGNIIKSINITGEGYGVYQALRLNDGTIYAAAGYQPKIMKLDSSGNVLATFGGSGPEEYNFAFFAGFQILTNGHIVVTNWQGHGYDDGANGIGLIEFDTAGTIVWSWMDHVRVSSLHAVLVLDSVNTDVLNDDRTGVLAPLQDSGTTSVTLFHGGLPLQSSQGGVAISARTYGTLFEDLSKDEWERIQIRDIKGRVFVNRCVGNQNTYFWNQKDHAGQRVAAGLYIVTLNRKNKTRINHVFIVVR